ncbi:MAG: peptidylprolyl isomerase [Candidatus Micrarchaeota archaeon]|nr:peptidylprolyl isomerase [Candidatus Micrarchaeota archaeon]
MSFNEGDFIEIDYSARRAYDKSLVYTTLEGVAKKEDASREEARYAPELVIVGKNTAIKGVDDAVRAMSVGEQKTVEIEPLDAFGERRDDLVTIMKVDDFRKRDVDPVPGLQVNIDGVIATIKSVNSGRVVVDANHPLAGEKLVYEIKVVKKLEKQEDKVAALAEHNGIEMPKVEMAGKTVKVSLDGKAKKDSSKYFVNKSSFIQAVFRFLGDVEKLDFEEEYLREKDRD